MQKIHYLLFLIISLSVISLSLSSVSMAAGADSSEAKVHIVYTVRPEGQEPEKYHLQTLTKVLGSEEAAKKSLLYSYKHAASGFSAKLTPDQVSEISRSSMEVSSSSSSISNRDFFIVFFLRPTLAVSFAISLLLLGWVIAWKLVLVHVPLIQEIFGLRKKPVKPKPENRGRFTQFYKRMDSIKAAS